MSRCPFATWAPITANYRPGGMGQIRGVVAHVQVGDGPLHDFFNRPATQASAHFQIRKDGGTFQFLDTDDMAWAQGAGNPYYWSCEFEGQVDEPMTSAQIDAGGRLFAWLHSLAAFPVQVNASPDGEGITPHRAGGAAWGGHSCPGDLRLGQYPELVLATLRYLVEQPPQGDDVPLTETEWQRMQEMVNRAVTDLARDTDTQAAATRADIAAIKAELDSVKTITEGIRAGLKS